jgi:hypothetical protein
VVRVLAIYLFVLIPVNWGVCRAIGRVEWAWAIAPLVAMVGAVSVVWAAQLDIGFVRATNELAILELQQDYPRAHVTRYTGLYASLSTRYDIHLEDRSGLILPFPDGNQMLRGQNRAPLMLHRDEDVHLENFRVSSNSIGLLHSEHMMALDGPLRLVAAEDGKPARWELVNETSLELEGVGVLHDKEAAWIDKLGPGERHVLDFALDPTSDAWHNLRERAPATAVVVKPGVASLRRLVELAETTRETGEWRLVAWTAAAVPGIEIHPVASQQRQTNLVVAHLRYGQLPAPERDFKTRAQIQFEAGLQNNRILTEPDDSGNAPVPGNPR